MKKSNFYLPLMAMMFIFVVLSCDKEIDYPVASTPQIPPPVVLPPTPAKNTPPIADAGFQQFVFLPITQTKLKAYAYDYESPKNLLYEWKKIGGSDKYHIDSPKIAQPALTRLEKGTYEFEFTTQDPDTLIDKDRVTITVIDVVEEYLFPKLNWICDYGCSIPIEVIISENKAYKLFIKTALLGDKWIELPKENSPQAANSTFLFGSRNNFLLIYSDDDLGLTDLKVIF